MAELMAWLAALNTATKGFLLTLTAATVGRLMFHAQQVRAGKHLFWSWQLLRDWPTAVGMGLIGGGAADYLGLEAGTHAHTAFVVTVAFLGTPLISEVFTMVRDIARSKAGLQPKD